MESGSRACPLCHSVFQDCGFSLDDPLHRRPLSIGYYKVMFCSTTRNHLLNNAPIHILVSISFFFFARSCLKQCHVEMMYGVIGTMIWGFLQANYNNKCKFCPLTIAYRADRMLAHLGYRNSQGGIRDVSICKMVHHPTKLLFENCRGTMPT